MLYITADRLLQNVDGGSHLRVGAICIHCLYLQRMETASQKALQPTWGPLPGGQGGAAAPQILEKLISIHSASQILEGFVDTIWNFI